MMKSWKSAPSRDELMISVRGAKNLNLFILKLDVSNSFGDYLMLNVMISYVFNISFSYDFTSLTYLNIVKCFLNFTIGYHAVRM